MFLDPQILTKYWARLLDGTVLTLQIVSLGLFIGAIISFPIAVACVSRSRWLSLPAQSYIFFFRGTPLLAQAFLIYYGFGQYREPLEDVGLWWIFRDAFWCGVMALGLNTGAYTAEIFRGGMNAIPSGVVDAGRALGLTGWLRFRLIIFPLALRHALPAYGNEIILTIKGSAVLSIITLTELMGQTRLIFSRTLALEVLLYTAVIYLLITIPMGVFVRYLEEKLKVDN